MYARTQLSHILLLLRSYEYTRELMAAFYISILFFVLFLEIRASHASSNCVAKIIVMV